MCFTPNITRKVFIMWHEPKGCKKDKIPFRTFKRGEKEKLGWLKRDRQETVIILPTSMNE